MNEQGMGFFLFGVILLITLGGLLLVFELLKANYNEACRDIGYWKHIQSSGLDACEDYEGNIHFVKNINTNPLQFKPEFKEISIGDVRGILR